MRIARAAHEDVEGGKTAFGPRVQADVRLREHGHARNSAIGGEVVQMDVQQRRAGGIDRLPQCVFYVVGIIEPRRTPEIDQEMRAGEDLAVALDEVVFFGKVLFQNRKTGDSRRSTSPDRRLCRIYRYSRRRGSVSAAP